MFNNTGEQKENIFFYHKVFAESIAVIQDLVKTNRKEEAKEHIILNYVYACALNSKVFSSEEIQGLKKKDIYDLLYLMAIEQKKANLVPTQDTFRDSYYSRIVSKVV